MYRIDPDVQADLNMASTQAASPISAPRQGRLLDAKRIFDLIFSVSLLILLLPLFAVLVIGVRLSSRGPVIYKQARIGFRGRSFSFYKFRSMITDSDSVLALHLSNNPAARAHWDRFQKIEDDPRITGFGRFIRRSSLDELPQIWNVLKGDMSFVGPRPCMPSQQGMYGADWSAYCSVRPGLTGLWQVSGRNRLTYEERVRLDVEYVKNLSFRMDCRILLKTIKVVLTSDGSH